VKALCFVILNQRQYFCHIWLPVAQHVEQHTSLIKPRSFKHGNKIVDERLDAYRLPSIEPRSFKRGNNVTPAAVQPVLLTLQLSHVHSNVETLPRANARATRTIPFN
jgi:hypothetical protein